MLNQYQCIGRVGRPPEVRTIASGNKVANFTVAVDESYKSKTGEKVEQTEWVNVVVWNKNLMPFIENYVDKGDLLFVQGKLKTRSWDDKDGNKRYTTEVVVQGFGDEIKKLSWKDKVAAAKPVVEDDDLEDNIPF